MSTEDSAPDDGGIPLGADLLTAAKERISLPVLLVIPTVAVLLFLLVVPVLISIRLSLSGWTPIAGVPWWESEIIWFDNFFALFQDQDFLYSVALTVGIVVTAVTFEFFIGFGLALLCTGDFPGQKFFVLAFLTPMMVLPVVVGNTFRILFRPGGPIDSVLSVFVGHPVAIQWGSEFPAALVPILVGEIWHWYPLLFLIMYSGLSALPENQLQAAKTLGASPIQVFRTISIPNLMPVILIGLVIRSMGAIKIFDIVFAITRGGPGTSTEVISLYLFRQSFDQFEIGYGSAGAWIIFIVSVLIFTKALGPLLHEEEIYPEEAENT
jgi:multiple sugar transport system permease protein